MGLSAWMLELGPEPLRFDTGSASALVAELDAAAREVDRERSRFVSEAAVALRDFAGVFAEVFHDHVAFADTDGQNLVTCLQQLSRQVRALTDAAAAENRRREGVRSLRRDTFEQLERQYLDDAADGLGTTAARMPTIEEVQGLVPFTPGTPPAAATEEVVLRPRPRAVAGSARGGGTSSARPEHLRRFSGALEFSEPGARLPGAWSAFLMGVREWGMVSEGGAIAGIRKWCAQNRAEREWIGRIAAEFERAGGGGGIGRLADETLSDVLARAGTFPGRDGLDLELPQTWGTMPATGYAADPVNTATGNFVEPETDLAIAGGGAGLVLSRMYNSQNPGGGAFGRGWSSLLDVQLSMSDERAEFVMDDGRALWFPREGQGWGRALHANFWLTADEFDGAQGWVVRDHAGRWWAFTRGGVWLAFGNGPGTTIRVERDADGRVSRLVHERGRSIGIEYAQGRPVRATGAAGASVEYRYDAAGRLVQVQTASGVRSYRWNSDGLIDQVTAGGDGAGVVECVNTYDAAGRVLTQVTAFGREVRFSYLSGRVTVVSDADGGNANSWTADRYGRLVKVTDTDGNRQTMSYDPHGNLVSVTDRDGEQTVHLVDERGRRTRTRTSDGADTWIEWDGQDRVIRITTRDRPPESTEAVSVLAYANDRDRFPCRIIDPEGGETVLQWDEGLLVRIVDPEGVVTRFDYDAFGDLTAITDALEHTTRFERDAAGRVTETVSPAGSTTRWEYDDAGRFTRRVDADGAAWRYQYGAGSRLVAVIDPCGARTQYTYGGHGALTEVRDPLGRVTRQRFDAHGNPERVTLPDGAEWVLEHDGLSRVREIIDPDGGAWQRAYSPGGQLSSVVDPTGARIDIVRDRAAGIECVRTAFTETVTRHDAFGRPVTVTADGGVSVTRYDRCGRVVEQIDADGGVTRYDRDRAGRVTRIVSPAGREIAYEYDACGRPAVMIDAAGQRTEFIYDADSRITEQRLANGDVARFAYDPMGRIVMHRTPGEGVGRYRYDPCGRVVFAHDTRHGKRAFTYDAAGQLTAATNGLGGITRYTHDDLGRIVAICDPAGGVTRRQYTPLGRVSASADPLGRVTTGTYDAAGRLVSQTDPDGRVLRWEYDADGQARQVHTNERTLIDRVLDHRSRTERITDRTRPDGAAVEHRVVRDRAGRLVERCRGDERTCWVYDADGLRTRMRTPTGDDIRYAYDPAGRLARVTHSAFGTITYTHDPAGNLLSATAGGVTQAWSYQDGYPVTYSRIDPDGVSVTRIERDPNGRITRITGPSGATTYTYDACEQLVEAASDVVREWEWDAAGRLIRERAGEGLETRYGYDDAGQLLRRIGSDGSQTEYRYDGSGRRIAETGTAGERACAWDERGWLTAITVNGDRQQVWVDALGELASIGDVQVSWDTAAGAPALTELGEAAVFAAPGGFTGVRDRWDAAGWRPARATMAEDPWAVIPAPMMPGGASGPGMPGAAGLPDAADVFGIPGVGVTAHGTPLIAGLEWMGARLYDPTTRGFLSVDPLPPVVGAGWAGNPYAYAGNDPLHALDPRGLSPITDADMARVGEIDPFWLLRNHQYVRAYEQYLAGFDVWDLLSGISTALVWLGVPDTFLPNPSKAKHWDIPALAKSIPPWMRVGFRAVPFVGAGISVFLAIDAAGRGDRAQVARHVVSAIGNLVGIAFWPVGVGVLIWDLVWEYGPGWWEDTQKRWETNPPRVKSRFSGYGER